MPNMFVPADARLVIEDNTSAINTFSTYSQYISNYYGYPPQWIQREENSNRITIQEPEDPEALKALEGLDDYVWD